MRLLRAAAFVLLLAATCLGVGSLDVWQRSGASPRDPHGETITEARGSGHVLVGAGAVALALPYPVTLAGYGPPRAIASTATVPPMARALVFEAGGARVGLVSIDLLSVTRALAEEVRSRVAPGASHAGLSDVWLFATHAHSSAGGYDARWVAELAGTGRYREEVSRAIAAAAAAALSEALSRRAPAKLALGTGTLAGMVSPRSGATVDDRVTLLRADGASGPVGELIILAAHPTLVPRRPAALEVDFPGRLAQLRERRGGVSLVLQGAVGNSSVSQEGGPAEVALAFGRVVDAVVATELPERLELSVRRARGPLPPCDGSRLVPAVLAPLMRNLLCSGAGEGARGVEVGVLRIGPLGLGLIPLEASAAAGQRLERALRVDRVVSLADDYLGYVEPPDVVAARDGESARQYFEASLLEVLEGTGTSIVPNPARRNLE